MSRRNKEKRKQEEEEWIQMYDLRDPQNQNLSRKFAQQEGKNYQSNTQFNKEDNAGFIPPNQNFPKQQKPQRYNKENERVSQQRGQRKMKKPTIPMMFVTCDFCTVVQNVPGNTQLFTCGSCQNMSECEPLYGAFNCGHCLTKVCYGFGISIMIKCPKCLSINKVPAQPQKKYESSTKKPHFTQRQPDWERERIKQKQKLYEYDNLT